MKWEVTESLFITIRLVPYFVRWKIEFFNITQIFLFFSFLFIRVFLWWVSPNTPTTFVNVPHYLTAYQNDIYCWRALPIVFRWDYRNLDIANKICTSNVSIKIHSLKLMPIKKCYFLFYFITGTWCWIIRVSSLDGT